MSDLYAGLEPDDVLEPELTLEPLRCVYPECEGLTFADRRARSDHGLATHLITALAAIQMPNPDLFKPKPTPEPAAELPIDWGPPNEPDMSDTHRPGQIRALSVPSETITTRGKR